MSKLGQTVKVRGGAGALDGATFGTSTVDGTGLVIPDGQVTYEDSGNYVQTDSGRLGFRIPRAGKYLVTAEWMFNNPGTHVDLHSRIQSDERVADMYSLSGVDADTSPWGFSHATQLICPAGDFIAFEIQGMSGGPIWSTFSITFLYTPTLLS